MRQRRVSEGDDDAVKKIGFFLAFCFHVYWLQLPVSSALNDGYSELDARNVILLCFQLINESDPSVLLLMRSTIFDVIIRFHFVFLEVATSWGFRNWVSTSSSPFSFLAALRHFASKASFLFFVASWFNIITHRTSHRSFVKRWCGRH